MKSQHSTRGQVVKGALFWGRPGEASKSPLPPADSVQPSPALIQASPPAGRPLFSGWIPLHAGNAPWQPWKSNGNLLWRQIRARVKLLAPRGRQWEERDPCCDAFRGSAHSLAVARTAQPLKVTHPLSSPLKEHTLCLPHDKLAQVAQDLGLKPHRNMTRKKGTTQRSIDRHLHFLSKQM